MSASLRIGEGWDTHALVSGRPLILGGVRIEHSHGLLGHSDADALLHAITDALFGAAALGDIGRDDNPLKNAPHTATMVMAENWEHDCTRERAAFPVASLKRHKYWPPVGRIDNAYGDRNIMCSCVPMEAYATEDTEPARRVAG